MRRCECEISAVLTERYGRTRDVTVPYGDHCGHGGHGGHGRRGAGATRDGVTTLITAITAPITAGTALAWQADVRTPERRLLWVPHRLSRASEAFGHTAGLARGGGCRRPRRRQPPGGLRVLSPGLGGRDKKNDATTNQQCTSSLCACWNAEVFILPESILMRPPRFLLF